MGDSDIPFGHSSTIEYYHRFLYKSLEDEFSFEVGTLFINL